MIAMGVWTREVVVLRTLSVHVSWVLSMMKTTLTQHYEEVQATAPLVFVRQGHNFVLQMVHGNLVRVRHALSVIETGIFQELTTQCDGLDNDCDGVIDDEPYFDADADGFTRCGTCRLDTNEGYAPRVLIVMIPTPLFLLQRLSSVEMRSMKIVDVIMMTAIARLDRQVPLLNHHLLSMEAEPALRENAYLSCSRLPRSDPEPTGLCSELDTPYFAGFVEDEGGRLGACMSCGLLFGLQCLTDGGCSDPEYDCRACNVPDEVFAPRPHCTEPNALTCRNDITPAFEPIFGLDPYEDCGELSCEGYYFGIEVTNAFVGLISLQLRFYAKGRKPVKMRQRFVQADKETIHLNLCRFAPMFLTAVRV